MNQSIRLSSLYSTGNDPFENGKLVGSSMLQYGGVSLVDPPIKSQGFRVPQMIVQQNLESPFLVDT